MEVSLTTRPTVKPEIGDVITFENDPYSTYLLIYEAKDGCYGLLNLKTSTYEVYGDEIEELLAEIGGFYTVYPSKTVKIITK